MAEARYTLRWLDHQSGVPRMRHFWSWATMLAWIKASRRTIVNGYAIRYMDLGRPFSELDQVGRLIHESRFRGANGACR